MTSRIAAHTIYTSVWDNDSLGNYIGDFLISDNIIENTHPSRSAIYLNDSITFDNIMINGGLFKSAGHGLAITGHVNSNKLVSYWGPSHELPPYRPF